MGILIEFNTRNLEIFRCCFISGSWTTNSNNKEKKMKTDKAIFIIEGKIPENLQHQLSKKIDEIAKSFGL